MASPHEDLKINVKPLCRSAASPLKREKIPAVDRISLTYRNSSPHRGIAINLRFWDERETPRKVSPPFEANLYTYLFNMLLYRQLQPYAFLKTEFYQRHLNAITTVGDPSLALFWLAKHVIIFLLIPGDPSLATFAEASVAETLGMT